MTTHRFSQVFWYILWVTLAIEIPELGLGPKSGGGLQEALPALSWTLLSLFLLEWVEMGFFSIGLRWVNRAVYWIYDLATAEWVVNEIAIGMHWRCPAANPLMRSTESANRYG